jgi:hypothetical protein
MTAPGGHIGLFMGARTLKEYWPDIGQWIAACSAQPEGQRIRGKRRTGA